MGSKAPSAPDYSGAASADREASQNIAAKQTYANRPNQYTPFGQSTWESTPGVDASGRPIENWSQNISLTPNQQRTFDFQEQQQMQRQRLGGGLTGQAEYEMGRTTDYNALPQAATTPDTPGYSSGDLSAFGSLPDPNQLNLEGAEAKYDALASWGGTPQNTLDTGALPGRGGGADAAMGPMGGRQFGAGADAAMGDIGAVGQGPQQVGADAYSPEQLQRSLSNQGMQGVDAGGGYQDRFAQSQYDRNMSLQGPQMQQDMAAMETRLRNQGLTPGSSAYDNAMEDLRNQQGERMGRMSQDAIMAGGQEQQRQFERESQLRGQQFGERGEMGQFYNQAGQQAFDQQMAGGGQRFGQQLAGGQFAEQQRAARAGESGQQFGQALQASQAADAQRGQDISQRQGWQGQQFGQAMQASQNADAQRAAAMGEQGMQFGQGMDQQQAQNALRGQQYGELQDWRGAQGAEAQGAFDRQMQTANLQDRQRQQMMGEQLGMSGQGFQQEMQAANYQNQLRQQAMAEEQQRRFGSINAMNALQTGQQVGMPSMPNFQGAEQAPWAALSSMAAQNQGNFAAQNYGSQMGLYGDLASAAGGAMPSDIRLKENVTKLGDYGPLDLVSWTWNGLLGLAGSSVGFIAQQVQEFYPEHVVTMPNGYLAIDYDALLKEV